MSTVLGERALPRSWLRRWSPSVAVLGAFVLLYAPAYWGLAHGLWREDEYAHAPMVIAVAAWLAWRDRAALAARHERAPLAGAALLAAGLVLYAVGRSQSLALFTLAAQLPILAGLLLVAGGSAALARFAFPLAFLAFAVPLPGFVLAALTAPLKAFASASVTAILHLFGYPAARSGVVISMGGHPLLVADACSGLNSLAALFALALLYAHLTGGVRRARAALLLAAVVPVALAANALRVLLLALVVYYLGDEAARGFLHGFAGMAVFALSFFLLYGFGRAIGIESALPARRPASRRSRDAHAERDQRPHASAPGTRLAASLLGAAIAMAGTALATPALAPTRVQRPVDLAAILPARLAGWRLDPQTPPLAPSPDVRAKLERLYGEIASRTYVNGAGKRMMLVVAYGGDQSDALKAHRQEVCYSAQGFSVGRLEHATLRAAGRSIPVTRFVAVRGARSEPVTYWFTMGDRVVLGRLERLRVQLLYGFRGQMPDGMLVRISSLSRDAPAAFAAQRDFIASLLAAMPRSGRARLAGVRRS
ncbi:MAG TPA: EpsI family protein [Usitatibacter sp.]|nr:EpsI family protein [Usitatibacter sp.]